ncbi:MAG: carboxylesterase family protein [Cytophagaceae bacterium]|nr:carboxylesterase family protein [Cytophagaceae bacterium]
MENIPYINSKNKKHLLDIFIPEGDGPFPVIVFIHGGSWYNGCKELYHPLAKNLSGKGIVSVIINYRLGNETEERFVGVVLQFGAVELNSSPKQL